MVEVSAEATLASLVFLRLVTYLVEGVALVMWMTFCFGFVGTAGIEVTSISILFATHLF